jgi:lipopolysaccharide export system protein LptA
MKWQKRARLVMAVLGISVVALVFLTLRERRTPAQGAAVTRLDPAAVAESAGGRLTQATGIRVPGVVDYERMLAYADGTARLIGPKITTSRGGQEYVITGTEANVGADQSHITMRGDVKLASSAGLQAETGEASYSRGEGIVRAPGRVRFAKGALRGTAVGMSYDQQRDVLWLLDQVVITVAPGGDGGSGADITAGSAGYARREKYMRFERGVRMVREGRTVQADDGLAYLSEDESRLESMELRGHSRIETSSAIEGGLQSMASNDMNLKYGGDGETLERAVLSGAAAIQMAAAGGRPGRRIAGEFIDIAFGPAGEITSLLARDKVQLALPADKDVPERVIRATAMEGTGEAGQGLTAARFLDGVEFRETPPGGTVRTARARTLDVVMNPGSGAIEDARFAGSTRFDEGALRASAVNGRYQIAKGILELTGSEGPKDPQVQNDRITVDAKRIDLTFAGPRLVAAGEVRSVLRSERAPGQGGGRSKPAGAAPAAGAPAAGKPAARQPRPGGPGPGMPAADTSPPAPSGRDATRPTVPGMLKDDQDVMVTADKLDYDGARSFATYTGSARLWQGDTTIQGDTIVIDETKGDLQASGSVRSAFVLEQADENTGGTRKVPSIASAATMHYEDALRRATYTTNAHVNGPQGDCHAEKIELYFVEEGGALERAEAYRAVRLVADARTATGDRMTYFAADERYLMSGAPVTIVEECRETTGKSLTFFRSTDRILVEGKEELRTLTKSGGTCAEPRHE